MKFLIVKLSSLGDIIHTLPLVYRLRQAYPDAQIDWLVGKKGVELLSLISELNNVYLLNFQNLLHIQKQKYDFVIDAQGLFKSGLLSKLSLGKKVIGFKNTREFADLFYDFKINVGNLFKTKKHIVELNLELLLPIVGNLNLEVKFLIPSISNPDNAELLKIIKKQSLSKSLPLVLVFPASTWESKLWPMDYWFNLLNHLSKDFYVCVCASNSDLRYIGKLIDKLDVARLSYENLVGKTTVKDLIYLVQHADLIVGLDSAGLHLASAVKNDYGSPHVIGIYGPTSLVRSGPYNLTQDCLYLSELACIACRKKRCPLGHHNCMNNIIPSYVNEMVYSKLRRDLKYVKLI